MNGFQPISYGENVPDINIYTSEIEQKLSNIQTYSSLILNNMGISVDTSINLPEFTYDGNVSQTGYLNYYGTTIMHVARNYEYTLGLDMTDISTSNHIEVVVRLDGTTYTVYPEYKSYGYFYSAKNYHCPMDVYIAENGKLTPNYEAAEGWCGIRFTMDKVLRAPITVLYIGPVRTNCL